MSDDAPGETELSDKAARSQEMMAVHDRAMRRFRETVEPQLLQREQCLQARRFCSIPGAQWEGVWGEQFEHSIRVEVNKVLRGVRKIEGDYRANRIVPDFRPAGGDSSNETADTLDGLHRADSYHFKAQQARDNAVLEAIKGGFGAYRLATAWADPYDKESDAQRVNPAMVIADADQSVFFDGNSKLYDKSDARFAFVLTSMTVDAAREEYDEDDRHTVTTWDDGLRKAYGWYEWFQPDMIRVCDYYEVEEVKDKLWIFTETLTGKEERYWAEEISAEDRSIKVSTGWIPRSRKVERCRVHKYVMSGAEVLVDGGYIAGDAIPIVPVYGVREFIDNQERFKGHVQDKMDSQRIYNAKISKMMETDALAPREIPILTPDMVAGHEQRWANQNIERHPYALINPQYDEDGKMVAMAPVGMITPPQMQPVTAALLQIAASDLVEDDADGADTVKANTSAEAMDIAATRVDAKSGIYLDNIRQSIQREGEIYLAMARDVYFEQGRKVETMTEEGDDGEAVLSQMVTDPKTGNTRVINDLQRGKYKVIADVQEATTTRMEKTVRRAMEGAALCIQAQDMEGAQAFLGTAVLNTDGEGMGDLQAWWRKRLLASGVVEPTEDERAEMERAAEQRQAPDPLVQMQMLIAQSKARLDDASAGKAVADTDLSRAKAVLTMAQAMAVGGPEAAPEVLSGLGQEKDAAKAERDRAEAEWTRTDAALLPQKLELERQKIRRGPQPGPDQ